MYTQYRTLCTLYLCICYKRVDYKMRFRLESSLSLFSFLHFAYAFHHARALHSRYVSFCHVSRGLEFMRSDFLLFYTPIKIRYVDDFQRTRSFRVFQTDSMRALRTKISTTIQNWRLKMRAHHVFEFFFHRRQKNNVWYYCRNVLEMIRSYEWDAAGTINGIITNTCPHIE